MSIRKIHRIVGIIFAPFLILTGVMGALLLLEEVIGYGENAEQIFFGLHNWMIVWRYAGLILAAGLLFQAVTGIILFIQTAYRKFKAKKRTTESQQSS